VRTVLLDIIRKILLLIPVLLIFGCTDNYKKSDLIGLYAGNKDFKTDTISIINDSIYRHFGINQVSLQKFNDTGKWTLTKDREAVFKDFTFYQGENDFISNIKGCWISKIYFKDDTIRLNLRRYDYFYKKCQ